MLQGGAGVGVWDGVKEDLESVQVDIADDLAAVKGGAGLRFGGLLFSAVKLRKALFCPLDLVPDAGQLVSGEGGTVNANIKAVRGGEGRCLFRRETGAAFQRFVLAVIGVGGFGVLQHLALAVQALGEHFAGVGGGKVYRAGADAADLVQNRLDLPVFLPQGVLPRHLAVVLAHIEVARPGDKLAGIAGLIAVVIVRPLGKAAGVAVQQGVQLVMVKSADAGLLLFYHLGGFVHGISITGRGAAGLVVAHVDAIVGVPGGFLVDGTIRRDRFRPIFRGGLFCLFCGGGLRLFCGRFCTCAGSGGLLFGLCGGGCAGLCGGGGGLFSPETVSNRAVKGLRFFRVLDGLAVLAKVPCIALDRCVQAVRLSCKIGGNVFCVGEGLDFDFRVLLVPLVRGGPLVPAVHKGVNGPEANIIFCGAQLAVALDAPEAVIPAAPIRIAGGVLDEVKAVVILEVCAGDLHHVAGFHGAVVLVSHSKILLRCVLNV